MLREADAAGVLWTRGLGEALVALRVLDTPPLGSMERRLLRRARQLKEDVRHVRDPEALEQLLAFGVPAINAVVAEYARCLDETHIETLYRYNLADLLRNRTLGPDVLAGLTRRLLTYLHDSRAGGGSAVVGHPWSLAEFNAVRTALSLPREIREAGWRDTDPTRFAKPAYRALGTPHPDPEIIDGVIRDGDWHARMTALARPDLATQMEDQLLGGEEGMGKHLDWNWSPHYQPSPHTMRRALDLWPDDAGIARRIVEFPGAPRDLLRDIARRWCVPGAAREQVARAMMRRDDALADPEVRGILLGVRLRHWELILEATDAEFPALFKSVSQTARTRALDALEIRMGDGRPHGLTRTDLVPFFAAGGRFAERALNLLLEIEGRTQETLSPPQDRGRRTNPL